MAKLLLITENYTPLLEMKFHKSHQKEKKMYHNHLPKKLSDPLQVLKRAGPMVLKFL